MRYFVTSNDPAFLSTARSKKACVCYLTQNINGLGQYLGHNQMNLDAFMDNFQINIFHANSSTKTNEFASRRIGKEKVIKTSQSQNESTGDGAGKVSKSTTISKREEWEDIFKPSEFSQLAEGSPKYGTIVESIIFMTGEKKWSNGKNYLKLVTE